MLVTAARAAGAPCCRTGSKPAMPLLLLLLLLLSALLVSAAGSRTLLDASMAAAVASVAGVSWSQAEGGWS